MKKPKKHTPQQPFHLFLLALLILLLTAMLLTYFQLRNKTPGLSASADLMESPILPATTPYSTVAPQAVRRYDWGSYDSCTVYSRRNMNTFGTNSNMLEDASQIRCMTEEGEKIMVTVADKKGHPVGHSIYRFWKDTDGYKLLIVDQNGAGSGEGYGKIVQLFNDSAVLLSCFYFISDDFITVNVPIEWGTPLSVRELSAVKKNIADRDNNYCTNFTLTSSVK